MFNIYKFIAAAGAAACLAVGCVKEMDDPLVREDSVIELIQEPSPQTKSSVSGVAADAVNNLTVAVFDNTTGMLADVLYFNPASSMKLSLVKGKTYAVCAVANVGDLSSLIRSTYASLNAFKSLPLSFASFAGVTAGGFPMASKSVSVVKGGDSSAPLTMEKLVAKYTVNIDRSALAAGSTVTVKSMNIRQAALSARPFADASERKAGTVSDGDYAVASDVSSLNSGGAITLYLLENRQGALLPGNADPKSKIPATQAQKDVCTYLEMVCSYARTDKRADNVTYRIYLGENNTSDFSIVRNTVYTLTLRPTDAGIDQPSWRLDPGDILTWTHSLSVAPSDPTIKVAGTQAFTATYTTRKFVNGHEEVSAQTEDDVTSSATWTSQNTSVATLSSATAIGVAAGSSYIKASYNGYEGGSTLTVEDDVTYDDEIVVSGPSSVSVGGTGTFTATKYTYKYVNGVKVETPTATTDVTASAVWSSSSTGVATVTAGTVKGIASGTATITATINKGTANEKSHSVSVTVADVVSYTHELVIAPESASIKIKGTQAFTATYYTYTLVNGVKDDTKTTSSTVTSTATWSSDKTGVATVSAGTVTGKGEGTATITATYEGSSDTATITVSDDIESYADPVVTLSYSPATVATAGGTATPTLSYSQTVTYLSGKTETLTTGGTVTYSGSATGFSLAADGKVTAEKNTGVARSITVTAKVAMNGKTGSKTATVSQNGDGVSSYDTPVVTLSYSPNPMGAAAGNATPTLSYSQTVHYISGETGTVTTGGTLSYSGSATGFTVDSSTGVVTAEKNTGNERSVTVTATVTVNGKSATKTATVTQSKTEEDRIVSASGLTIDEFSYSPETIDASGGTSTPTVKYSQTVTYESGTTETLTQEDVTAELNFTGEAEGFTVIPQTGVVIATKNTDIKRSVNVTAIVTLNGKTATMTTTVEQESKLIKIFGGESGSNYHVSSSMAIPYPYSVEVEFEVACPSSSGGTVMCPGTYKRTIKSRAISGDPPFTVADVTSWPSDAALVHAITGGRIVGVYPTTVGDYTVIFEAGDFIKSYDNPVITLDSSKKLYVDKNGARTYDLIELFNISCSQTERWNSGKTTDNPDVTMRFYGSNKHFIIDSNTGVLTTKYNGTGYYLSIDITVVASANGKSSSKTFTVYQLY